MGNSIETDKRRGFEIAAVVATGLLKHVFMDWLNLRAFYIGVACMFWSVYIYKRYRKNRQILQHWGFRKNQFNQSFLFLTPFALLITAAIVWYGVTHNTVFLNWHVIPVFIFYPVWGFIQQFLMLSLIAGNLMSISAIKCSENQIILLTSAIISGFRLG